MASGGQSVGLSTVKSASQPAGRSAGQTGGPSTAPSTAVQSPLKQREIAGRFTQSGPPSSGKGSGSRVLLDCSPAHKAHGGWRASEERLLCRGASIMVLFMLFVVASMFLFFSTDRVTMIVGPGWYLEDLATTGDSTPSQPRSSPDEARGAEEAGRGIEGDLVTARGFDSEERDDQGDNEDRPGHKPELARGEQDRKRGSVPQEEW